MGVVALNTMRIFFFNQEDNLLETLDHMREHPLMWFTKKSVSQLYAYLSGYQQSCVNNDIEQDTVLKLTMFQGWQGIKYCCGSQVSPWIVRILEMCDNDEERAYDCFFEEWDEFCRLDLEKLKAELLDEEKRELIYHPKEYWVKRGWVK